MNRPVLHSLARENEARVHYRAHRADEELERRRGGASGGRPEDVFCPRVTGSNAPQCRGPSQQHVGHIGSQGHGCNCWESGPRMKSKSAATWVRPYSLAYF